MKGKTCEVCGQRTDIYTGIHKKEPFVDGKNYAVVCFTCYFVPKTLAQRYDKEGSVLEEEELPYSPDNLCTPRELQDQGAADSPRQAKTSVEAVQRLCKGVRKPKKPPKRPRASWNVCVVDK